VEGLQVCYITTGGMVPEGADAVVPAALPPRPQPFPHHASVGW